MIPSPDAVSRLDQLVGYWAHNTPDACACTLGDLRFTFAELQSRIDRFALALLAHGVKKGDRVATLSPPNPDYLTCFLATSSIGAIWVGLNPRYQLEELKYVLQDSAPVVLFARTEISGRNYDSEIQGLREATSNLALTVALDQGSHIDGVTSLEEFERVGARSAAAKLERARAAVGSFDPCLIVYTSGSTGRPKGALLHHHAIARFGVEFNKLCPTSPVIAVNYFPINHVSCTCDLTMPSLVAGGKLVFLEKFDPVASLELMQKEGVTLWGTGPSPFQMQLDHPDFAKFDLSAVQLIGWGGAAMPEPLIRRLMALHPRLSTNYGMTETMLSTSTPPTDDIDLLANTVGSAFPGVEIKLVQTDGTEAPLGEPGEIWVRSDYNLIGYWNRPEATAEAVTADGFFKTGDIAVLRPDGNYRLVGRIKEMYKSGGYNVYPREVETVLEEHALVKMAAVVSVPDPRWQEVGIAYLVSDDGLTARDLEQHCRAHLANYKIPKRFVVRSELPLLPNGKIDKLELKKIALQLS